MRPMGFSTGSLAYGNFRHALDMLRHTHTTSVELSALRFHELPPLIEALSTLDVSQFEHVSIHAPGRFPREAELSVIGMLQRATRRGWSVVLHPDAIYDFPSWKELGQHLLIENMDKRKPIGRTAGELSEIFVALPDAGLCFDIAHARQVDPSMAEAYRILTLHGSRLRQLHISEVTTASLHGRISYSAMLDYQEVARYIPGGIPAILETPVAAEDFDLELARAAKALEINTHPHANWSFARGA